MSAEPEYAEEEPQFVGDEAGLVNQARANLKAIIDNLDVIRNRAIETLTSMDTRLRSFDGRSRRLEETTEEKQAKKDR